ncbi:MAG: ArsR/SmtB family transcription factor [Bacillota bacterium]
MTDRMPPWSVLHSLPANLATALLLVDYACHGTATPTPWPATAAERLSAPGRERLELLRAVLAHGWVLRTWLIRRLEPAHPAQRSWPELRRWLAGRSEREVAALVSLGIRAGLLWEAPPGSGPAVDEALADPARRVDGLRRVLQGWKVADPEQALALALNPIQFQAELLALLDELWESGFRPGWEAAEQDLAASAAALASLTPGLVAARSARALVTELTGLEPTGPWAATLDRAPSLLFIPTLHLGRFLAIAPEEDLCLVLYEPAALRERGSGGAVPGLHLWELADLGEALIALGDANRLAILNLLSARGTLYGQQIVEQTGVHQSTVSRNLALLERGGLVAVRREGNMKRYSLNRPRVHEICRLLTGALG